jgi:hypothetical protein
MSSFGDDDLMSPIGDIDVDTPLIWRRHSSAHGRAAAQPVRLMM